MLQPPIEESSLQGQNTILAFWVMLVVGTAYTAVIMAGAFISDSNSLLSDGLSMIYGFYVYLWKRCLQNYKTAVKWLTLSAEGGFPLAFKELGYIYEKGGNGILQDFARAHMPHTCPWSESLVPDSCQCCPAPYRLSGRAGCQLP